MIILGVILRKVLKIRYNEELIVTVQSGQYKGYFISYNKNIFKYNFRKYMHGRIVPVELGLTKEQAQFKYRILMERGE